MHLVVYRNAWMTSTLILLVFFFWQPGWGPLEPAWSPDNQIFASTQASERFVTPEGANYTLLFNERVVYPKPNKKSRWFSAYQNQHTFLSELEWSPDSQNLAFVEKIYDWEYTDPYNRDFNGSVSKERYYLVVVSRAGHAAGYPIQRPLENPAVLWRGPSKIVIDGQVFDLHANPPSPIN